MLSGLILLTVVFVNSLFSSDERLISSDTEKLPAIQLDISGMKSGEIRKVRWGSKEVAVLLRQFPEKLEKVITDNSQENSHPTVQPQARSIKLEYFVYINLGDSKNCPLYYAAGEFKDVCSSNKFDETGRDIRANLQGYKLQIPPHYFVKENIVFGQWSAN